MTDRIALSEAIVAEIRAAKCESEIADVIGFLAKHIAAAAATIEDRRVALEAARFASGEIAAELSALLYLQQIPSGPSIFASNPGLARW